MRVGIVGGGVVGSATAHAMKNFVPVSIWDKNSNRCYGELSDTLTSDVLFICLPTPSNSDGRLDTSYIEDFFDTYIEPNSNKIIVIKSTVPIGFTRALMDRLNLPNLIHSPEFLTARTSYLDANLPPRNLIGYCGISDGGEVLYDFYSRRFPGIATLVYPSPEETEAIKLITNSFFAVKVAFFNEIRDLVTDYGMNYESVLSGILGDGRITPTHTKVPGPDGMFGFGGSCLPKDLMELICFGEVDLGLGMEVTRAASKRNARDRSKK